MSSFEPTTRRVTAGEVTFEVLEVGTGPLALCLHGFPDTPHTWRHLMPELAAAGYHAVAPWSRGYAPTDVPADGDYSTGALVADACALHQVLGGDERAVIIGHDWGAGTAYAAATFAPELWASSVILAVPPAAVAVPFMGSYDQLKRSWYMSVAASAYGAMMFQAGDFDVLRRLWADWSPGYDATEDLAWTRESLGAPGALDAALGYYRAVFDPSGNRPELAGQQAAGMLPPVRPTLYLHGADDGGIGSDVTVAAADYLSVAAGHQQVQVHLVRCAEHRRPPAAVGLVDSAQ